MSQAQLATSRLSNAKLNFVAERGTPSAFEYPFVHVASSGEPLHLQSQTVPVHNLRTATMQPTLEKNGFMWASAPFDGLLDEAEGWEDRYMSLVCQWLKDLTGARAINVINYQIRRRSPGESRSEANYDEESSKKYGKQPVPAVHVDINKERARTLLADTFGDDSTQAADVNRVAIINVWRPLRGPVLDAPLAVCDSATLNPEDMEWTIDKYGGGYFIRYNERQRWMYIRDQMPDEVLIFRQYDSTLRYGKNGCVPHTAFIDEERKDQGAPRQSIEVRLAVLY